MAVYKEYRCSDCNRVFDSIIPSCIHCGSTKVTRVFITPFGFKSDKTKDNDKNLKHLVGSYGLTDYSNNESTHHDPKREIESRWAPVAAKPIAGDGVFDNSDLANAKTGSVDIKPLPGKGKAMPFNYSVTHHKDHAQELAEVARVKTSLATENGQVA